MRKDWYMKIAKQKQIGRKCVILPILLAAVMGLAGCGKSSSEYRGTVSESEAASKSEMSSKMTEDSVQTKSEETRQAKENKTTIETEPETKSASELQSFTVDNVTFSVDGTWEHMPQDGYEGTYITPDQRAAYQLQGVSALGSYTPEDFFEKLILYYTKDHEVIEADDTVEPFVTADHLDAYVGRIQMTARNVLFSVDVLIVPQKNTVVTFAAQCAESSTLPVDIREVTSTAVFDIGTEDSVSGNTFLVDDSSQIELGQDSSFIWYQTADDSNSAYCSGTYEVYYGQAAFDKIVSMTEYGLTEEELEQTLSSNMNGYTPGGSSPMDFILEDTNSSEGYHVCRDTFYAIILHNEQLVDGTQTEELDNSTLYIGYYLPELQMVDLLNANTANQTEWTLR